MYKLIEKLYNLRDKLWFEGMYRSEEEDDEFDKGCDFACNTAVIF